MPAEKHPRSYDEMSREAAGKDYAVCDQCRVKKIRCGREKPFCSNCVRLGQKCEWSGHGKKCNQTALLSHTIVRLSKRLESLEAALAETQNTVKRLVSESSSGADILSRLQPGSNWPTPEENTPVSYDMPVFKRPLGHFKIHHAKASERYFGPTSLESLLHDMDGRVLEPLIIGSSENPTLSECALLAQHKFDLLVSRDEEILQNGSLPTGPPLSILKAMIEPYFATINPHFPIWSKESFIQHTTALHELDSPERDLAQVVCSNNLILMTLAPNSLHPPPHPHKPNPSKAHRGSSTIDLDLTKGFLANAKRAIEHAELLISPRLINVQALLSLCVVAQEHMSLNVFAKLFNLASQCAKSIGLHDWESSAQGQGGDEESRERQCVSYCLYVLDKAVCWAVGASPSILASDVSIKPAPGIHHDPSMNDLVAKARLAEIQESIHSEIYALRAPARTETQVRLLIFKFDQRLQQWLADWGIDLEEAENGASPTSTSTIELSVGFTCTQLLYLWPFREHPDVVYQRIEISRRCIRLLLRLWRSAADLGRQGVFPRAIASHPPLYLHEIATNVVAEQGHDSDADLLQSFAEMLHNVTDLRDEGCYNRRLYEVSTILVDVITSLRTQRKRRRTQQSSPPSSLTSPTHTRRVSSYSTPPSDMYPAVTAESNNMSSQVQCSSQTPGKFPAVNFGPLLSPADSRAAGSSVGCSDDGLATIIGGSFEKGPFETFDLLTYAGSQSRPRTENLAEKEMWWN
ncbi:hypothetical protein GGS23DRAFT_544457 [Durotheca rogersii]|uniref:uncharacterized protein n=1 Tax=Durotheca rogersii TaxID=419775 RepID=UPI00221F9815|nr:uncharacterized protein GGS23DRAFT_544457 [Durotheca rogersii]KAI5868188.1 hypothetical protein GGS23DRAFT_544457 [Durotheca rogersii]